MLARQLEKCRASSHIYCHVHHQCEETSEGPPAARLRAQFKRVQENHEAEDSVNGFAAVTYASKYTVGDHISHPMFGHGTVTAIDENKLTIEFSASVTKQIVDSYVTRRSP